MCQHLNLKKMWIMTSICMHRAKYSGVKQTLIIYVTCREFDSVSPGLAIAASIAVVVVPIFDPSVSGYALSRLMTPIPGD